MSQLPNSASSGYGSGIAFGAYTQLDNLLKLRFLSLKLKARHKIKPQGDNTGGRQSIHKSRGIDFEEVRIYQQGDDIRTIDWRVTARTSITHTKIFREERDRPVFILLDQRQPMFFGSVRCCKSVQAAYIATLLAWAAHHRGDQIGGCVMGNDNLAEVKPKRGYRAVLQFLNNINLYNNKLKRNNTTVQSNMQNALANARRCLRPGNILYIISDCSDLDINNSGIINHLHYLAQHCELMIFHTSDRMERQLPKNGRLLFTDGTQKTELHLNRTVSNSYQQSFEGKYSQLSDHLLGLHIPLIKVDTADDAMALLAGKRNLSSNVVP